jgi:TonB-dependent starch-binding outer membrane protein SusC
MRKIMAVLAMVLGLMFNTFGQGGNVTGRVTDLKDGTPIPGVTIRVKGGGAITTTALDGTFMLPLKQSKATVEFTSIGFITKSVAVNAGSPVAVQLEIDSKALSEIVVTGTGSATSKKKLAFAVETITADKLPAAPTADIGQALVGKIAGAQISSVNGSPGQPVQILLRGINTIQGATNPMILLDGVQVAATNLESLDLTGIERVEVVQGSAASTMYGAQGANGVIQLFSKKGKQGKVNVDVSTSIANNELLNIGGLQKAKSHSFNTNANNEVIASNGEPLVFDTDLSHYERNVIWNSTKFETNNNKAYDQNLKWYDHYKMFFHSAPTYNNSISVSGAKDKIDFNFSLSDNRQESVFKNNGNYSRTNLISNIGAEIFKGLKFRSITQLVNTRNTLSDPTGRTIMYMINNSRPFANYEYKSPDGNYGAYFGDATGVNGYNFNYVDQYTDYDARTLDIVQSLNLNYKVNRWVELDAKYGLNYQDLNAKNQLYDQTDNLNADYWQYWAEFYYPRTSYGSPTTKEETGEINNRRFKTVFQNLLTTATIKLDFDKDFNLRIPLRSTTFVGYDYRNSKYTEYFTYGLNAPTQSPYTAADMATYRIARDYTEPFVTYGYLINQRFDWGDIAGVSAGFRSDYSSAFGQGSKPFTFPRGDAYLRISSFNFWQDSKLGEFMPEFKIRGAYGEAGIQPKPFDRYPTLSTRNIGSSNAFVFPTSNPNTALNVENSKELEVGADMTFNLNKGRWFKTASISASYWDRKTEGAIFEVDAAPSTGLGTIKDNAFGLASHGFQASLNLSVFSSKSFTWNLVTNFGKQTSKISSVIGKEVVVTSAAGSTNYVLKPGEKIGQLYGYLALNQVDAIDPSTGQPFIAKDDQGDYEVASNGYVVNKSTRFPYFSANQYSFGDPNPKFNMSFINEINYKGYLTFGFQFDWVSGAHLYNQTKEWMYRDGIHKDYDKPITIDGQTGAWTSFYRGVYAERSRNGTKSYFYENSSFLRLRNISLGFDIAKVARLRMFNRLQLVVSGRNLFTSTKYTGMDPEVSSGASNSPFDRGVDHNTIPNLKTIQVGLNIGF